MAGRISQAFRLPSRIKVAENNPEQQGTFSDVPRFQRNLDFVSEPSAISVSWGSGLWSLRGRC